MSSRKAKGGAASTTSGETIKDHERLIDVMDRFCAENSHFESSTVANVVRSEMGDQPDIHAAALVPLRHKIFGFDAALKWGFFLSLAVPRILVENGETLAVPFDIVRYNKDLPGIYDLAVDALLDVCEEDESDDEDEDDEDDDDE